MRPAILLLCCLMLLLTGCPSDGPAHPAGGTPSTATETSGLGGVEDEAPLFEVAELPADYIDEPLDRTGAGITEGTVTLAGSVNTTGVGTPLVYAAFAEHDDVLLLHFKATLDDGAGDLLTVEVVPAWGATQTYRFPPDGAWHYQAVLLQVSGDYSVKLHNRPGTSGILNGGAATVSYYLKNQNVLGDREPNDDGDPATTSDYNDGTIIPREGVATQSVFDAGFAGHDFEDWHVMEQPEYPGEVRTVVFTTYGQRYCKMSYRLTCYTWHSTYHPYPDGSAFKQVGLPIVVRENSSGCTIRLSNRLTGKFYFRVIATPMETPPDTNIRFQLYGLSRGHPAGLDSIQGTNQVAGTADQTGVQPFIAHGTFPGPEPVTYSWNFGGGASCVGDCTTSDSPAITLGSAGSYTGQLQVNWGQGQSSKRSFRYSVACDDFAPRATPLTLEFYNSGAVVIPTSNFSHLFYTDYMVDKLMYGRLSDAGVTNTHPILSADLPFASQSGIIHEGRIFIAYVDDVSEYLFFFVSRDLNPTSGADWTQYSLTPTSNFGVSVQLAEIDGTLCIAYGNAGEDPQLLFAKATKPAPLAMADWAVSPIATSVGQTQMSMIPHAGRLWLLTLDQTGALRLGYARKLLPEGTADWSWMVLSTKGAYAETRWGGIQMVSVADRLAVSSCLDSGDVAVAQVALSTVTSPFSAGQFTWSTVKGIEAYPLLPTMKLTTDGERLYAGTLGYNGNLCLSWSCPVGGASPLTWQSALVIDDWDTTYERVAVLAYEPGSDAFIFGTTGGVDNLSRFRLE